MTISQTDKELLLAYVLKKDRSWVLAHKNPQLTTEQQKEFDELVTKREVGWPLQYLTKTAWFYNRQFHVEPGVLIPRPETELLVEAVTHFIPPQEKWNIFDIGCGSGIIGITLANELPECEVHCSDSSKHAIQLTDKNAQLHKCAHMIVLAQAHYLQQWGDELKEERPTVIVGNLPYLSHEDYENAADEVKNFEPKEALLGGGTDGTQTYRQLFKQISTTHITKLRGVFIEYEPHQTKILISEFKKHFPQWEASVKKDLYNHERVLCFTPPA